jgi:hypothetical protein
MEKEELIKIIKEWVKNDNEIRTLKEEQRIRQTDKKKITEKLMNIMRANQIDCFDINDGQIQYKKRQVKKPITQSVLLNILSTYYEGDTVKANEVNQFIKDNRVLEIKESIVRKIHDDPSLHKSVT